MAASPYTTATPDRETLFLLYQTTQNLVANLWTEFSAQHSEALVTNGKELQNP
jgi:hypothetical protein